MTSKPESPDAVALQRLLSPVRGALGLARFLQVIASTTTVVPYVVVAELARRIITGSTVDGRIAAWAIAIVVVSLFVRATAGQSAYAVAHLADLRLQNSVRRQIVDRLEMLPLGWFSRNASGAVRARVQDDVASVHSFVAHGAVESTAALTTPIVALIYLFVLNLALGVLVLAVIPIYFVIQSFAMRGIGSSLAEMNRGLVQLSASIVEFVNGISVVKMYGRTGVAHERYRRAATEFGEGYARWVGQLTRRSALISGLFSSPMVILVVMASGMAMMGFGWCGPVETVTAALIAATIPPVFNAVSVSAHNRREAEAASLRIATLLDEPALIEPEHRSDLAAVAESGVEFHDVCFDYEGREVLHGLNLNFPSGSLTALVGPSGAGKSTIAGLIARFHDPSRGRILLGGVDLRELGSEQVHRNVGVVLQDAQLVRLSVADNIRLGRRQASLEEVHAAAKAAHIHDEIEALPRGYESVIGDDAVLSGGQRQRVAIARAMIGSPRVVVLDEATAFADPESEAEIQAALSQLLARRTVVVIAHRLETIQHADQIVVLDDGHVVEQGNHHQLLSEDGRYAALWRAQTGVPGLAVSTPADKEASL